MDKIRVNGLEGVGGLRVSLWTGRIGGLSGVGGRLRIEDYLVEALFSRTAK